MKKELDFSKGTRGKFYRPGLELHLPVYLDKSNQSFVESLAKKKKIDVSSMVNQLLKADQDLLRAAR